MGLDPLTNKGIVPVKRFKRARAAYYALISHIDFQIGRFLLAMNEYGVLNNTIIFFVSDHGEMLGDHHCFAKSLPYEGSSKILFIISDHGNLQSFQWGSINNYLIEHRDIMPSNLDEVDVSIPESVDGQSVLPLLKNGQTTWRNYIHGEHELGNESHHFVTNGKKKYIWYSQTGEEQFFDLEVDPCEMKNMIDELKYKERIQKMRRFLINELDGREEGYSDGTELMVGKVPKTCLSHILTT